jgi:hypothetical protein
MEQQKRDASEIHNNAGSKETLAFQGNAKLPPYILPGTHEEAHWRLLHPTGPVTKKMAAVNPISQPQIMTWLAKQSLGEDHELISYLESLGHWMLVQICNSRCDTFVFVTTNVTKCENRK